MVDGPVPVPDAQGVGVPDGAGEVVLGVAHRLQPGRPARAQRGDRRGQRAARAVGVARGDPAGAQDLDAAQQGTPRFVEALDRAVRAVER